MSTKLRPSCADSVTATSRSPRGQKRGWETTAAQHAGFITRPFPINASIILSIIDSQEHNWLTGSIIGSWRCCICYLCSGTYLHWLW